MRNTHRLLSAFALVFAAFVVGLSAQAAQPIDGESAPHLVRAVHAVAAIARVTILRQSPVVLDGAASQPCGFVYSAVVVQALKGLTENQTVQFFSGVKEDFNGLDRDYLVFLWSDKNPRLDIGELNLGHQFDQRRLDCFASSGQQFYVPNRMQNMWALDPKASRLLGGDWLAPPTRHDLVWCFYTSAHVSEFDQEQIFADGRTAPFKDRYRFGEPHPPDWYAALSWKSAQYQIEWALRGGSIVNWC